MDLEILIRHNEIHPFVLKSLWGIEREGLRINEKGEASLAPHPEVFGDKLQNRQITTDFAENQIEIITSPLELDRAYEQLEHLTDFVLDNLGDEYLWPLSMPLDTSRGMNHAKYRDSVEGRQKSEYRKWLSRKYGMEIQSISGIHVNFSFHPALLQFLLEYYGHRFKDQSGIYMHVLRNLIRKNWLFILLFGASPQSSADMNTMANTVALSYRNSPYGYRNKNPFLSQMFNSKSGFISEIEKQLLPSVCRKMEIVPSQCVDNYLYSESEAYIPVRPKTCRANHNGPLSALKTGEIDYLELRSIDINPYCKTGLMPGTLELVNLLALQSLFSDDETISDNEYDALINFQDGLSLGKEVSEARKLAKRELDEMKYFVSQFQEFHQGSHLEIAIALMEKKLDEIPLAEQIMKDMANTDFPRQFGLDQAKKHRKEAEYGLHAQRI